MIAEPEYPPGEEMRTALISSGLVPFPSALATVLDKMEDGWGTLWVQRELSRLGDPAALRALAHSRHDPDGVLNHLRLQTTQAEDCLRFLEDRGLAFDFTAGRLTLPSTGGAPRAFYRSLVAGLDAELAKERPKPRPKTRRERIAELIKPFFSPKLTSPGSTGLLARTIDNG